MTDSDCKESTCKIIEKTVKDEIDEAIDSVDDSTYIDTKDKDVPTLTERIDKGAEKLYSIKKKAQEKAKEAIIGGRRPDLRFLGFVISSIVGIGAVYLVSTYILSYRKLPFSVEEFLKSKLIPESRFSIHQLSEVRNESNSIQQWLNYYRSAPFSPENMGIRALRSGTIFLPIISFLIIYIVPPIVLSYITWFIIRYWKFVINAIWGWFLTIYRYSTRLVKCKLASKWYIRMVTGWSRCNPSFASYFVKWRRTYIDRPLFGERLKYVKQYRNIKERYYTRPKRKYIILPYYRYGVHFDYWWDLIFKRVPEVFYQKILNIYANYYLEPRDALYRNIYSQDQWLQSTYDDVRNRLDKLRGKPFESKTPLGRDCVCPPRKTPLGKLENNASTIIKDANTAVSDVSTVANQTRELYNQFTHHKQDIVNCKTIDTAVDNHKSVARIVLVGLILTISGIGIYSAIWGAPPQIVSLLAGSWKFAIQGTKIISKGVGGKWYPYVLSGGLVTIVSLFAFV